MTAPRLRPLLTPPNDGTQTEDKLDLRVALKKGAGHSYDNALAESTIGLFKTEVIDFMGPWKSVGQVEWETLKWVNWYNTKRLHSKIGYFTPQEAEEKFYEALNAAEKAA